ncbi:MAG TPA: AcvB/VirJ family lysyl-phosphatidylglycerol hydrolase [Candidatus Macondimonas sp.]|nr:AcvB/VirJ family lysyl-phosphatidylglycerol hydrolase [Candidatus Macondimonas sp.]
MTRRLLVMVLLAVLTACQDASQPFSNGRFDRVWLDFPQGDVRQVVLWLMPGYSRTGTDRGMARALADEGALVISVSTPDLLAHMAEEDGNCILPAGDLENLAHEVQARVGLERYLPPWVGGRGSGAALTYAVLAQAPLDSFVGGLSLDFAPTLALSLPLCSGRALTASFDPGRMLATLKPMASALAPWAVVEAKEVPAATRHFLDQIPAALRVPMEPLPLAHRVDAGATQALRQAYRAVSARLPEQPAVAVVQAGKLPLIEIPAQGATDAPVWAVLLSGDGGWAGLDRSLSRALAAQGVPVVGLDSLRYFWQSRTPEGLAADLQRIVSDYGARWQRSRVILIGYSQGANVLPFAFNRLSPEVQARVERIVLLGPGEQAAFTFRVSQWWHAPGNADLPILPEVRLLPAARTLCVYGKDEAAESLCPRLQGILPVVALPGGHHFDGDLTGIAQRILSPLTVR